MAVQLSTAVRNARLDQIETTIGTAAKLELRTGAQEANCAAAATGTLLATLTLPTDWMAAAASGSKSLAGTWTGTGSAAGTAAHFRITDNAGTTCHMIGSVASPSGGDLNLDNNVIAVSQTINVTSFTLTDANA